MIEKEERRPGGATPEAATKSTMTARSVQSIPTQLRRRRDAADRCVPIDGYREPLDRRASRNFKAAWITTDDQRAVFTVKGRGCVDTLRREGLKPYYARGLFYLDLSRLPDAVAALEWSGYVVRVRSSEAA